MRIFLLFAFFSVVFSTLDPAPSGSRSTFFSSSPMFSQGTVSNKFCGLNDSGECEWYQYAESVLLLSGFGIIVGILCLLFMCCFYVTRPCGCFGGNKPTHGCFCAGDEFDFDSGDGYTTRVVWILKPIVLLLFLAVVASSTVGLIGNQTFNSAMGEFTNTILTKATTFLDEVDLALQDLTGIITRANAIFNLSLPVNITEIDTALAAARDIVVQAQNTSDYVLGSEEIRYDVVISAYIVSVIVYFVLLFASCVNTPMCARLVAIFGFFAMALGWISFSISHPLSTVLGDFCSSVDTILNQSFVPQEVRDLVYCENGTFGNLGPYVENALNLTSFYSILCSTYNYTCSTAEYCSVVPITFVPPPAFPCEFATCAPGQCSSSNALQLISQIQLLDFQLGCPPDAISSDYTYSTAGIVIGSGFVATNCGVTTNFSYGCPYQGFQVPAVPCQVNGPYFFFNNTIETTFSSLNPIRDRLIQVRDGIIVIRDAENWIQNQLLPLLSCTQIQFLWNATTEFVCVDVQGSITQMWIGSVLVALCWMCGTVVAILGIKRFNKKNRVHPEHDVMPPGMIIQLRNTIKTVGKKTGATKTLRNIGTKKGLTWVGTHRVKKRNSEGWDGGEDADVSEDVEMSSNPDAEMSSNPDAEMSSNPEASSSNESKTASDEGYVEGSSDQS